jgi:hypothetical protein
MFLGTFLQAIITVVFIYLILSLLASELQENVAAVFELRAKRLKASIQRMFGEDEGKNPLTQKFYEHPNIISLNQSRYSWLSMLESFLKKFPGISKSAYRVSVGPSYIDEGDASLFAETVISIIRENRKTPDHSAPTPLDKSPTLADSLKNFDLPADSAAYKMLLKVAEASISTGQNTDDWAEFKKNLQEQYREVQKRSSGVYKRNSKGLSLLIGFLIAGITNADTFNIVSSLSKSNQSYSDRLVGKLENSKTLLAKSDPKVNPTSNGLTAEQRTEISTIINDTGVLPLGWNYTEELEAQAKSDADKQKDELNKSRDSLIQVLEANKNACTLATKSDTSAAPSDPKSDNPKVDGQSGGNQVVKCSDGLNKSIGESSKTGSFNRGQLEKEFPDFKSFYDQFDKLDDAEKISDDFSRTYNNLLKKLRKNRNAALFPSSKENRSPNDWKSNIGTAFKRQGGFLMFLGWFISAIAISMGAPFWFDVLGRVMNVRNAGGIPKKSTPEKEKS